MLVMKIGEMRTVRKFLMEEAGRSCSNTAFVEPLIDNDSDAIERMADSPNVDVTESVAST